MRRFISGLFLLLLLSGCRSTKSAAPASTDTPAPPTFTPQPPCSADVTPDFEDYASWTKVNPKPIPGHETYVNIYVDDSAKDIYLAASGETFPTCARIVKTHLEGADSETITAITVMVKMPAGYDPQHNDWWWGMFDKDGKVAEMSGKVPVCIACHQPVAAADYVFSKKVIEESDQ